MKINEYIIKYDNNFNLCPSINRTFDIKRNNNFKYGFRSTITAIDLLQEIYDIHHLSEEHTFVFAIKGTKLLGIYPMSKGTDCSSDMSPRMIFRFLLLIGANAFIVAHNHPNGNSDMSQDDYEITLDIMKAADFMDFEFIDHVIVGREDCDCIKEDVESMIEMNCKNVVEYYKIIDSQ